MNFEINKTQAIRWFEELWSQGNLSTAEEIIDPEYDPDWVHIEKKGPDQVKHEINYFRSVFPDLVYKIIDISALEDRVWVRYLGTGTQIGPAWGFEASNKKVNYEGVTIFYFNEDGMIIDRWGAFCFYDLLSELGHVPPFWELKEHLKD